MSRGSPRGGGGRGRARRRREGEGGGAPFACKCSFVPFCGDQLSREIGRLLALSSFPLSLSSFATNERRASEQGMATKKGGSSVMRSLLRSLATRRRRTRRRVEKLSPLSLFLRLFMTFGATPDFNGSGRRGLSLSASLAPPQPPASLQFPHCSLVSPAVVVVSLSGTRLLFFSSSAPCSPSAPSADICPSALHFRRDST